MLQGAHRPAILRCGNEGLRSKAALRRLQEDRVSAFAVRLQDVPVRVDLEIHLAASGLLRRPGSLGVDAIPGIEAARILSLRLLALCRAGLGRAGAAQRQRYNGC